VSKESISVKRVRRCASDGDRIQTGNKRMRKESPWLSKHAKYGRYTLLTFLCSSIFLFFALDSFLYSFHSLIHIHIRIHSSHYVKLLWENFKECILVMIMRRCVRLDWVPMDEKKRVIKTLLQVLCSREWRVRVCVGRLV